ncbi:MAG: PIN domain-containing protein [Chloroflexi bacterium]|nr:PIN domain-containing protein [Chloroflexota bacterium]
MREAVLDANVLLRYLTDEPREMADRVAAILEAGESQRISLVLAPLTLAEVVYVLESVYRWPRKEIADRLLDLISASVLTVLEQDSLSQALTWYHDLGGLDFADAYIAAVAAVRGHGQVVSFDRHLQRVPGITAIQDPAQLQRD